MKKVAIVGWAESTRDMAPIDDPAFDLWGCNEVGLVLDRPWAALFQMHPHDYVSALPDARLDWLRAQSCPIYALTVCPDFPTSVRYPIERAIARFGRYFTSTIAYMLALAILEGRPAIHVYGVDMGKGGKRLGVTDKYGYQRSCCEYLIGYARGLGIDVHVPPESALLNVVELYGYDPVPV